MRVLIYNWAPREAAGNPGGGISSYQRNLAPALREAGICTAWLSSGAAQSLRPGPVRWQARGPGQYRLINSRPFAPGHAAFGDPAQLHHAETEAVFAAFLKATGPWDAIHFDSLEGLPAAVLEIAAREARTVLMLHNYYPFCPQVNLWREERETCRDFENGAACPACLRPAPRPLGQRRTLLALRQGAEDLGGAFGLRLWQGLLTARRQLQPHRLAAGLDAREPQTAPALARPEPTTAARAFAERRAAMITAINRHCHSVLCVSSRVRDLAQDFGLRPDLLHITRIGSPDAARPRPPTRPLLAENGALTLAYLGYLRRDKGFWFLLRALETLPAAEARRLHLILAARPSDPALTPRIRALAHRLGGLTWHKGYSAGDLDRILAPASLGVIPVLWEDNLPQIALEMHQRGLALLTSDLGGARELGNAPALTFPANNHQLFQARLSAILRGEIRSSDYGKGGYTPRDMNEHLAHLLPHWRGSGCDRPT